MINEIYHLVYQYNAVLSLNSWESGYAKDKLMQKIGIA